MWVKNFVEIPLSSMVFEIQAFLCFAILAKNLKIQKWPSFLSGKNYFENWDEILCRDPCGLKISAKSLYLAWFSRYKHFCVLQFLQKIQNGRHIWLNKNFLKIGMVTLQR